MKACPIPGCATNVRPGYLMCREHWSEVPLPMRRDVNRTWRAYLTARGQEHFAVARIAYRMAAGAAVDHVTRATTVLGEG